MRQSEPVLAFLFTSFLLILWLGFLIHRDARFAGSFAGGVLAVSGSLFLLVPLIYSIIKRVPVLKRLVTKEISFSSLLTVHIYAGFTGAVLVLLHTGHKFHGNLAVALTTLLLIVVFSGYLGRYLIGYISKESGEKKRLLTTLETQFSKRVKELQGHPEDRQIIGLFASFFSRVVAPTFFTPSRQTGSLGRARDILQLSDSIADVEYAISTHQFFKRVFSIWLKVHIALSFLFYFLLFLHVVGEYHFGLRWFL